MSVSKTQLRRRKTLGTLFGLCEPAVTKVDVWDAASGLVERLEELFEGGDDLISSWCAGVGLIDIILDGSMADSDWGHLGKMSLVGFGAISTHLSPQDPNAPLSQLLNVAYRALGDRVDMSAGASCITAYNDAVASGVVDTELLDICVDNIEAVGVATSAGDIYSLLVMMLAANPADYRHVFADGPTPT